MVRVILPHHLKNLARVEGEVHLEVPGTVCAASILDELEARLPVLKGTIREHVTNKRRAYLRFFAAGEDVSFAPATEPLPTSIAEGRDPFMVVGAVAGG